MKGIKLMKRYLALLIALCMMLGMVPMAAAEEHTQAPVVLTDEDYVVHDAVWADIYDLEDNMEAKRATRPQVISAVAALVEESPNYVEGSLEFHDTCFTWKTTEGIACMYEYEEHTCDRGESIGNPILATDPTYEHISYATKGKPAGKDVYLIGPYYGVESSFTDHYKTVAKKVATATGGSYNLYARYDATIDNVAKAMSNGAIVLVDSHGTYHNPDGVYRSYLRLQTSTGITTADYNNGSAYSNGSAYMVTGDCISAHMTKDAINSFVFFGICSGMRYKTMFTALRNRGVEAVFGYSRTVGFAYDRSMVSAVTNNLIAGKTLGEAVASAKSTVGSYDTNNDAYPIVVSDEDNYPSNTQTNQAAKSTWTLYYCEHSSKTYHAARTATCTKYGYPAHYACNSCTAVFTEAAPTVETHLDSIKIPATGHKNVNGVCSVCGGILGVTMLHFWPEGPESNFLWTFEDASGTSTVTTEDNGYLYSTSNGDDHYFHMTSGTGKINHPLVAGDIIEMRYRTTKVPATRLNGTEDFELWYTPTTNDSTFGSSGTVYKCKTTVTMKENTWQTVQFTPPTTGVTIARFLMDFLQENRDYSDTKLELDYIFIGPAKHAPSKADNSSLMFDFADSTNAELRYASEIYNDRNYSTGFWAGNANSVGKATFDGESMYIPVNSGATSPYIQTVTNTNSLSSLPLSYKPAAGDYVQIRFKLENLQAVSGANPSLRLYYIKNNQTAGVDANDKTLLTNWKPNFNGEYVTVSAALNDTFTAASVINAIRVTFTNVTTVAGKTGGITIDYIAIGPADSLPEAPVSNYTVTFADENGKVLATQTVVEGDTAKYTGATPVKAYDANSHYAFAGWVDANGKAAVLSNISGDVTFYASFAATAHSYSYEVVTAPTCENAGLRRGTCACGYSYTEAVSATGHTPVVDKAVAATCSSTGLTEGSHCGVCHAVLVAQQVLPTTGHTVVVDAGVAPTCLNSGLSEGAHCSVCGTILKVQEPIARLGHNYVCTDLGNGTHAEVCTRCDKAKTAQAHTPDANGVCTLCGNNDSAAPSVDESIVIRHTLDLASDISVTFAVPMSNLASYDSYYMECVLPEYNGNMLVGTSTVKIDPVVSGSYYYFTLTGITAVRMGDMVDATLHMSKNGAKFISKTDSYSVATYAYAMLNSTIDSKMLTLCADLLRYGAEAQSFKGYRTDALVDASMTAQQRAYLSNTETLTFTATDSYLGDTDIPFVTWVGKTLDLGSKVGMKFVFNTANYVGNIADLTMKVSYKGSNGETKTVILTNAEAYGSGGTQYSFTFYGLLASELRTIVDVAIYEGDMQISETLRYSAESYAAKNTNGALAELCKALFAYSDSAKAYFAK